MKSILISIRPEWVAKILNGEKTIEIRKTFPMGNLPIDVYIYCTKSREYLLDGDDVGYFCWDKREHHYPFRYCEPYEHFFQGKVVAKFRLKKVVGLQFGWEHISYLIEEIVSATRLSIEETKEYLGGRMGCLWHISDLEIFDEPKSLEDFGLKRAPQSWRYIDV